MNAKSNIDSRARDVNRRRIRCNDMVIINLTNIRGWYPALENNTPYRVSNLMDHAEIQIEDSNGGRWFIWASDCEIVVVDPVKFLNEMPL